MRTIFLITVVLLTACASQPEQTATYLLRSAVPATTGTQLADSGIALGNVRVADYIEQPGLVLETDDGKIQAARNHVWAEPLQVSLRRFLASEISASGGSEVGASAGSSTRTHIDVTVDQLHGNAQGAAVLVAFWQLASAGSSTSFRFSETLALSGDGYNALVQAEEALLRKLAGAIAASLPRE